MRRAAKVDGNHSEIRDHLRSVGWSVFDAHNIGRDFPDLVCARRGFTALVEVKNGDKAKLRPGQQAFAATWPGVCIKATTPEDAAKQLALAESFQFLRRRL